MKLIKEITEEVQYLVEERDGKKSLFIEGPFLVAERVNRNGRMYKTETLAKEVNRYNEEFVQAIDTTNRNWPLKITTQLVTRLTGLFVFIQSVSMLV